MIVGGIMIVKRTISTENFVLVLHQNAMVNSEGVMILAKQRQMFLSILRDKKIFNDADIKQIQDIQDDTEIVSLIKSVQIGDKN